MFSIVHGDRQSSPTPIRSLGLAGLALVLIVAGCGSASSDNERQAPAKTHSATASTTVDSRCPAGPDLIAQVRQLEKHGSDAAIADWKQRIQAGPEQTIGSPDQAGCASFATLSDPQIETYVDLLYHGRAEITGALVLHQTPAAQQAILQAYRRDPDAVTHSPSLAAAVAMAEIQTGRNYQSAYQDLAFGALNGGIDPSYVRGYLSHFGCRYEDAIWAAKTKQSTDFFDGDAFPVSTSPSDGDRDDFIHQRLALLQQGTVPDLRADCPLSAQYAADHNGDPMMRMKLKAQQLKNKLDDQLDEFAHKLFPDHDDEQGPDAQSRAGDSIRRGLASDYAQFKAIALRAADVTRKRWQACADRLDNGLQAAIACWQDHEPPSHGEKSQSPADRSANAS
ncbi:hypothetical protein V5738_03090 [Salinisphaera sp. SPP-AMP-43]|uniref:hypothetical protein n=1 Tax=Salinisphaera sp. SPP-AMP-43 TaxID=3121288 RepID=UPI003C6E0699